MHYSLQPRFVKGYGFLSLTKNMGKNIGKNIRKNLSGKYSQIFIECTKRFATDTLKISWKRLIQKSAEATVDFIANKIVDAVAKFLRLWNDGKIHYEIIQRQLQMRIIKKNIKKDMYLLKKDIIDELRLKYYNNGI